jgi:hypothetical protein
MRTEAVIIPVASDKERHRQIVSDDRRQYEGGQKLRGSQSAAEAL